MADTTSLVELVNEERPGTEIDILNDGKNFVVGFHCQTEKVWIALSYHPPRHFPEDVLGCLANMMICCLHCPEETHELCHHEFRVVASRLRKFLGDKGFQRFLDNAPIVAGKDASS